MWGSFGKNWGEGLQLQLLDRWVKMAAWTGVRTIRLSFFSDFILVLYVFTDLC